MYTNALPQTGLTSGDRIKVTDHIKRQMAAKGITAEQVLGALRHPYKVTPVTRYPGQRRYCGQGVAVVVEPEDHNHFILITVYEDGILTPLRADQMNDPAALNSSRLARR